MKIRKTSSDLLEQFKGRKNTLAICDAVDRQVRILRAVLKSIKTDTNLETAVGTQLDYIGDILCLSRKEAALLCGGTDFVVLEDEDYRRYLKYKAMQNTGDASYDTLMASIKAILGENASVSYSEDSSHPATIILEAVVSETELKALSPMKAAGVGLDYKVGYYATIEISHYDPEVYANDYEAGLWQAGDYPLSPLPPKTQDGEGQDDEPEDGEKGGE